MNLEQVNGIDQFSTEPKYKSIQHNNFFQLILYDVDIIAACSNKMAFQNVLFKLKFYQLYQNL